MTPGAFLTTSTSSGRGDVLTYVTKLNSSATAAVYSTYLGRAGLADIAVDSAGSAYVVGGSASPDFPVSSNAFQKTLRGDYDAVAVKLNPTGTALEYSTFLGSTATDWAIAIAVDRDGYAYLTGSTNGPDFPTTPGAHDTVYQGYLQIRESATICHEAEFNGDGTYLFHFSQWDSLSLRSGHRSGRCRQCSYPIGRLRLAAGCCRSGLAILTICCPDSGRRCRQPWRSTQQEMFMLREATL